ncbi:MAG: heme exporter protein CcmD [Alphaproteobacteria bacterium]|jgi:heme exporter protein D|nr:heme exporter protein CcmD [Alphaproteobacteria bacterium]MBL6775879.1 heme exporter protein CcmD [Alphaproteobacteria bacterium]MDC1135448.1 heme exporter protein CcmD [Alphaproteobacteria bacterium]
MTVQSYEFYIFASYAATALFVIAASLHSWLKAKNIEKKSKQD